MSNSIKALREALQELITNWRAAAEHDRQEAEVLNSRLRAGETVMIQTSSGLSADWREKCANELEQALAAAPASPAERPKISPSLHGK